MSNWVRFLISLAIPLAAGFVGSVFTNSSVQTWYPTLNKPVFNPPNWLFAPVWTLLFVLMGISFYLVWRNGETSQLKLALVVYFTQLALNVLWSLLFFGVKSPLLGLIDIFVLWGVIVVNIYLFIKVSRTAGYLLIPYLLWVSFASTLNFAIVLLN